MRHRASDKNVLSGFSLKTYKKSAAHFDTKTVHVLSLALWRILYFTELRKLTEIPKLRSLPKWKKREKTEKKKWNKKNDVVGN